MVEIKMYKTELRPSIKPTLKWPDGTVVDLTGCSAKFQLVEKDTGLAILNKTATILSPPTSGKVQYDWEAGDTNVQKDKYKIRIEITFPDAKVQTFPRADNFFVTFADKEGT
jgi:hypothetical protein